MKVGMTGKTAVAAVVGGIIVTAILILGTIWMGQHARRDTSEAVRTVSLLYLDELAGRREQVVSKNLQDRIRDMQTAIGLMDETDLSDLTHLQAYQARMKQLYVVDKFAFVDTDGLIYTALGTQTNIGDYDFDYRTISGPEVSVLNLHDFDKDKKVVIAVPVDIPFGDTRFCACFMEIDMSVMLSGISMESGSSDATFCNIYTPDGIALSNTILGGLSAEDNLLDAMQNAEFEDGSSYEDFLRSFAGGEPGEVSFVYAGISETLSYAPVSGTDWQLTYLIRESVINERISHITESMLDRSILQSVLTVAVLLAMFALIFVQTRNNAKLLLSRETAEAEVRGKQEELEQRIELQKQLEEQSEVLQEALTAAEQASKAKTVFLSNMSHEIRTPMNAIIGLNTIALNDPGTPETTRGYLTKIGASAEHLLGLINDILDMTRIESGNMVMKHEPFSFRDLLEAVNTMFMGQCQDKGLDYQCRITGEVEESYIGDGMKLRQVLINILGNAVKFTPAGGSVELGVACTAQFEGHSALRFTISDTGIGMSEDFLPHLFDTFAQEDASTTNKYGSSGLGMAITKSIVDMMNGTITARSKKGEGTTFEVSVTLEVPADSRSNAVPDDIRPGDLCVLVVDDDPIACEHAKLVLEKAGITTETASSGAEAVEMARLRHARMEPYSLILLDWKMPEMDGVETALQIRSVIGDESAIIILTAYKWDDVLEEALRSGVDSFLPKPVFAAAVLEEYRSALSRRGISPDAAGQKAELTGRRVLLAEDMAVNAEIMIMVLQMRQIAVDHAENGRIAVDMFAASPEGTYDAILMDMRMPEMDGLQATRTIRAMDRPDAKTVPIIALTANAFDEDVQRSLQAGLNAHLSKPVQPETLFETLEDLIRD